MLAKLRNRKVYLFSTFVIVFALLAKMLVPIAHASNNTGNGQKSFLASLCSGKKIIFVELSLPIKSEHQPKTIIANSKCPLCSVIEQDVINLALTATENIFESAGNEYFTVAYVLTANSLPQQLSIRAPPYFLAT